VSSSGFYTWLSRPPRDADMDEMEIVTLFNKSKGKLGILRLKMAFERFRKKKINHKKVRRIKREFNLVTQVRKKSKYRAIFRSGEESKVAPNIVQRQFNPEKNEIILSTDITQLTYSFGQKAYLSAVKDLRTKEIVTYSLSRHPTVELAIGKLPQVLSSQSKEDRRKIIIHSDQGGQYCSPQYLGVLEELEVTVSMSRKGNCLDNAPIESFFGHFKDEAEYEHCRNFQELSNCVRNYMKYYNYDRPQWGLKQKTPAEAGVNNSLVF
jgi:putative transposase